MRQRTLRQGKRTMFKNGRGIILVIIVCVFIIVALCAIALTTLIIDLDEVSWLLNHYL